MEGEKCYGMEEIFNIDQKLKGLNTKVNLKKSLKNDLGKLDENSVSKSLHCGLCNQVSLMAPHVLNEDHFAKSIRLVRETFCSGKTFYVYSNRENEKTHESTTVQMKKKKIT